MVRREQVIQATGLEAMWAVETDAVRLKTLMAAIEDGGGLGRLFDIDVLDAGGKAVPGGSGTASQEFAPFSVNSRPTPVPGAVPIRSWN